MSLIMDDDNNETTFNPEPSLDPRWVCWKCGALALLDDDGLCHYCWPERVLTFSEVCGWAAHGGGRESEVRWRIG